MSVIIIFGTTGQTMSCPCYRAIYSATVKLPAAVLAIVSDYAHTFSDADFERLVYTDTKLFIVKMTNDALAYRFAGNRNGIFTNDIPSMDWIFINHWHNIMNPHAICNNWFDINLTYIDAHHQKFFSWGNIHFDKFAWEFLRHHFGRDTSDYAARRSAIWHGIKSLSNPDVNNPMPEMFNQWCDQMLETIGNELYNRPHTLVCPWSE
jgi:hypothetical protein